VININIRKELLGSSGKMDLEVDIKIEEGSFVALAGESGSGKTTLLRILAGLEKAEGKITVNEALWLEGKQSLATQKRGIGFVFQDYALFPNMSVEKNLLFVKKDRTLATKLLEMTHMLELKDRLPLSLSGGQKQRVALCRALMNKPSILLLDEPLSALDPSMRTKLQHDILKLHKEFGTTTIMVSHDPSEIYRLADRVLMLEQGKVVQDTNAKDAFLKTRGSQKFSLQGELLEIIEADILYIAIVAIGQQLVEVVLDEKEAKSLKVGQSVQVNTKAFAPSLSQ